MTTDKVHSMTGFGRATVTDGIVALEIEVKSVNSRFLDLNMRLPRPYSQFEPKLREMVGQALQRGRVEILVMRQLVSNTGAVLEVNQSLIAAYLESYDKLAQAAGLVVSDCQRADLIGSLLVRREVAEQVEQLVDMSGEEALLIEGLKKALLALCEMRATEGMRLAVDLRERLKVLRVLCDQLLQLSQSLPGQLAERLRERVTQLNAGVSLDPERLAQEVVLLADRADVTEELVRLASHLDQFDQTIGDVVSGRKLEFILQEIGRELNTIGSKSPDGELRQAVVAGKSEVERMREQVLNLE